MDMYYVCLHTQMYLHLRSLQLYTLTLVEKTTTSYGYSLSFYLP